MQEADAIFRLVTFLPQVRKSFFAELGIYENETFIRQVYYDFILGKGNQTFQQEMPHEHGLEVNLAVIESTMEPDDDLIAITNYQFPITDDHDYYD